MFKPTKQWIAKGKINKGDAVVILWKNYMRKAKANDTRIVGVCEYDVRKGQKVSIIVSLNGQYETDVKCEKVINSKKGLFRFSHSNEDIKENPIFSKEALKAMKNLQPDKKGIERMVKGLRDFQDKFGSL